MGGYTLCLSKPTRELQKIILGKKVLFFFQYLVWYIYSLAALAELITGDSITLVMSKSKSKTFTKPFTKLLNKISNLEKKT